jgi:flagellar motor switch protein FliN/FliY
MANPDEAAPAEGLDLADLAAENPTPEPATTKEAPNVEQAVQPHTAADLHPVYDVPVQVSAVLGKATLRISQLLKLGRGAVVELDRKVGEAIDIYINDRLVARGEIVVVEDRLGVTMTEIIKSNK